MGKWWEVRRDPKGAHSLPKDPQSHPKEPQRTPQSPPKDPHRIPLYKQTPDQPPKRPLCLSLYQVFINKFDLIVCFPIEIPLFHEETLFQFKLSRAYFERFFESCAPNDVPAGAFWELEI